VILQALQQGFADAIRDGGTQQVRYGGRGHDQKDCNYDEQLCKSISLLLPRHRQLLTGIIGRVLCSFMRMVSQEMRRARLPEVRIHQAGNLKRRRNQLVGIYGDHVSYIPELVICHFGISLFQIRSPMDVVSNSSARVETGEKICRCAKSCACATRLPQRILTLPGFRNI
jgi:hypothetical protein